MLNHMTKHSDSYQPLETKDSFRVLELLPGILDDPLQCRIQETTWSDNTKYEALSYVWGPPVDPMTVEDISSKSVLRITENLFHALRILRYNDRPRVLWIDALCINQSDNVEKGHQVKMMGEIYRKAENVVVWLGEEECDEAVDLLEELGLDYASYGVPDTVNGKPVTFNADTVAAQQELLFRPGGASLKSFFERPYFERIWVKQEFALAKTLIIHIGHRTLDYERLRKAMHVLWILRDHGSLIEAENSAQNLASSLASGITSVKASFDKLFGVLQMGMASQNHYQAPNLYALGRTDGQMSVQNKIFRLIHILHANPTMLMQCYALILFRDMRSISEPLYTKFDLLTLWKAQLRAKCTNKRDKLFGLLGLTNPHSIDPDYESPMEEVWLTVTLQHLRAGDLGILHHSRGLSEASEDITDSPSFVPDFTAEDYKTLTNMAHGRNKFLGNVSNFTERTPPVILEGRFPELSGVLVDHVVRVTKQFVSRGANDAIVTDWDSLRGSYDQIQRWMTSVAWPYNESVVGALAQTFIANNFLTALDLHYADDWMRIAFVLLLLGPWKSDVENIAAKVVSAEEMLGAPLLHMIEAYIPGFVPYDPETGFCVFEELLDRLDGEMMAYTKLGISQVMFGRVIFLSSRGYLGVGPEHMHENDLVVIPDGALSPFIMRPAVTSVCESRNPDSRTVHVVGDCYLHGWMDGELFGNVVPEYHASSRVKIRTEDDQATSESGINFGSMEENGVSASPLERDLFVLC